MPKKCSRCKKDIKIYARGLCRSCYIKEFTEEKRSQGICTHCRSMPIDFTKSNSLCSTCFDKGKLAYNRLKQERIKNKCCVDCGKYTGGYYRCKMCNRRNNSYKLTLNDIYNDMYKLQAYLEERDK